MRRRFLAAGYLAVAISGIEVGSAIAQDAIKIGVVIPMTGAFAPAGREVAAGAKLYIQQHGDTVAGQKIELIIRDDAGVPDNGKRLAQELIVKERVSFLGAGITYRLLASRRVRQSNT
jgi:branched-chain amino acid transport system substrate-binding protein